MPIRQNFPCQNFAPYSTLMTPTYTHVHLCTLMYTHVHSHTLMYTHVHTHVHSHTLMYTHVHSHTLMYTHVHSHTLMYTHVHSCTPMYTHVYPCTPMYMHSCTLIMYACSNIHYQNAILQTYMYIMYTSAQYCNLETLVQYHAISRDETLPTLGFEQTSMASLDRWNIGGSLE